MKSIVRNTKQLASIVILLTAVSALMFSALPAAMAMPDPTPGGNPDPSVQNAILNIEVTSSPRSQIDELIVYDTATTPVPDNNACPLPIPAGIKAWRLVSSGDTTKNIRAHIPSGALTGIISAPFGTGVPAVITVDALGGAELSISPANPFGSNIFSIATATWLSVGTVAGPPSTDRIGNYNVGVCGFEDANLGTLFEGFSPFTIDLPVGGEVIPVGTTSLMLAGISTSALWLVPLVAIAGVSFALIRFQVLRKED